MMTQSRAIRRGEISLDMAEGATSHYISNSEKSIKMQSVFANRAPG